MRLEIRYRSSFAYAEPVRESHNVLRACPTTDDRQQLVSYRVSTNPGGRMASWVDYWGTRVDAFGIAAPHSQLEVLVEAVVDTRPTWPMTACPRLGELRDPDFVEQHLEYLEPSPHAAWNETLRREAEIKAAAAGDDVVGVVLSLHRAVGTSLTYKSGTTYVGIDVNDVFERKAGVCQDFVHLLVAMCRAVGIPARYVSGYLDGGRAGSRRPDAARNANLKTHAWAEVAIPGGGWWGLDPTNQQEIGPAHVKIGHGRDYDDVLPLRGVYRGPASHRLDVSVRMLPPGAVEQQQQ
jgi:transglutaminase-like putative cysteine protease